MDAYDNNLADNSPPTDTDRDKASVPFNSSKTGARETKNALKHFLAHGIPLIAFDANKRAHWKDPQNFTTSPEELARWQAAGRKLYGYVPKTSGFLVIDRDRKNRKDGFHALSEGLVRCGQPRDLFDSPVYVTTPSGNGRHDLFRYSGPHDFKSGAIKTLPGVDLIYGKHILFAPGSRKRPDEAPDAEEVQYVLYGRLEDVPQLTPKQESFLLQVRDKNKKAPFSIDRGRTIGVGRTLDDLEADLLKEGNTPDKGRNNYCFDFSRTAARRGHDAESVFQFLLKHEEPDFTADEIRTTVESAYSYKQSDYPLTDLGNAERLKAQYGERLRYCEEWGKFLAWDGRRWTTKSGVIARQWMIDTVRQIYLEANAATDSDARKKIASWGISSESQKRIECAVALSKNILQQIAVGDLDKKPWLLNCQNGTIDLKTGKLNEQNPDDCLTGLTELVYDPDAKAPLWEKFLLEIMEGRKDFASALQRIVGYCLTGDVSEHALFLLWGKGANGKSTLTAVIRKMLGAEYAAEAMGDLLLAKKSDGHPTELAHLHGKRCMTLSEANKNRRLNEGLVKRITGGDQITARRMREDLWSFEPSHKFLFSVNDKPVIKGTDSGIWRRIVLVPFKVSFTGREDRTLTEKLFGELQGILAWAVRGCLDWKRNGLQIPEAWQTEQEEYRAESDELAPFIADKCETKTGYKALASTLYDAYVEWCNVEGREAMRKNDFGAELQTRGYTPTRIGGGRGRAGLKLREPKSMAQRSGFSDGIMRAGMGGTPRKKRAKK